MEYNEFLIDIKNTLPNRAIDLYESLDLLKMVMDEIVKDIGDKATEKITERKFDEYSKLGDMAKFLCGYEQKLKDLLLDLEIDESNGLLPEEDDSEEKSSLPDYEKYKVDNKAEHTLYENFTHIRPYGFRIGEHDTIVAMSWQRMLIKTCEYLFALDREKFFDFEDMPEMNGKKNKYFSRDKNVLRKPGSVHNEIYIEMNMSGNSIRNFIAKMLREYRIPIGEFKVFFRADYTEMK